MRQAGVLMAISSLPSKYGVGDFGSSAYEFVDRLYSNNIKVWQILPFNRLGYGNSPYQAYSSVAGDDIFISLDELVKEKLLKKKDLEVFNKTAESVDYEAVRVFKSKYLKLAYDNFLNGRRLKKDYKIFIKNNKWVKNYCVFLALKQANDLKCWIEWTDEHKNWIRTKDKEIYANYQSEIEYYMFLQFIFYRQWFNLKQYINEKSIKVMGDIPFYVGIDSVDVWENPKNFLLDKDGSPTFVAGCPPDFFSADGQRWGNPIYNWKYMTKNRYKFWIERLRLNMNSFDLIRIDHFRAFDTYWKIPASCPTAIDGEWVEAPGYDFFDEMYQQLPNIKLVAEDLGLLRPEVHVLRDHYGFAGMDITQFTFDPQQTDLLDKENMIAYTGTHDNTTVLDFYKSMNKVDRAATDRYFIDNGYSGSIPEMFVQLTLNKKANLAIVPIQDIIGLKGNARMNTPGTIGTPNWEWKLVSFKKLDKHLPVLKEAIVRSGRSN